MKISIPLPEQPPAPTENAERPSIFIPTVGKTVVQLTSDEVTKFEKEIAALEPPIFFELIGKDKSSSIWCLEEDLLCLTKPKAMSA